MTHSDPAVMHRATPDAPAGGRARDAQQTRERLLLAARRRFAHDGYSSTTVRGIAADVGVNVALINRYFASKEGLFEACLTSASAQIVRPDEEDVQSLDQVISSITRRLASSPGKDDPLQLQLLLMLRSSGDDRADAIRRTVITTLAERMAAAAGWSPADISTEALVLRAQIALATAVGVVTLRSSTGINPLSSAGEEELGGAMGEVLHLLLSPPQSTAWNP